jgi:hypothetical protein
MRLAPKIFLVSALVIGVLSVAVGWSALTVKRLVTANHAIATRSVPAMRLQARCANRSAAWCGSPTRRSPD